jgi:hypothetical protein
MVGRTNFPGLRSSELATGQFQIIFLISFSSIFQPCRLVFTDLGHFISYPIAYLHVGEDGFIIRVILSQLQIETFSIIINTLYAYFNGPKTGPSVFVTDSSKTGISQILKF